MNSQTSPNRLCKGVDQRDIFPVLESADGLGYLITVQVKPPAPRNGERFDQARKTQVGILVNGERFATAGTARQAYQLKGIETAVTAVGVASGRQITTEGANGRVYGIKESSTETFPTHDLYHASWEPDEDSLMPELLAGSY
jgi:hypothetical protein